MIKIVPILPHRGGKTQNIKQIQNQKRVIKTALKLC